MPAVKMRKAQAASTSSRETEKLAALAKALGHPARLGVIKMLHERQTSRRREVLATLLLERVRRVIRADHGNAPFGDVRLGGTIAIPARIHDPQPRIGEVIGKPYRIKYISADLKKAVDQLTSQIGSAFPDLPNARWVALRLLDGDERIAEALRKGELGDLTHGNIEARSAQLQVIGNQ